MLVALEAGLRRIARALSPSEWAIRLLGLSRPEDTEAPGLLLIQIDGLSRTQLERAMREEHLPFLRRLLQQEGYLLHAQYSGLPASTPAVQAELFYGVKTAVPAFCFRDHEEHTVFRMYDLPAAAAIEARLQRDHGPGLLEDGSAWTDIFSGGAAESHFCASTLGWGLWLRRSMNPLALGMLLLTHVHLVARILGLMAVELALAVVGFVRGTWRGKGMLEELLFILTRVAICILLRELVVTGVQIDLARGLPIIHVNFIGYDEQAHRRGPASRFAHWSLRGIDAAIARLWRAAHHSHRRHYDVWVYSDHGQEGTQPFPVARGRTVQAAVAEVLGAAAPTGPEPPAERRGVQSQRAYWLRGRFVRLLDAHNRTPAGTGNPSLVVTSMGGLGHVYPPQPLDLEARLQLGPQLVRQAGIPLVLTAEAPHTARAWTPEGSFQLPQEAAALLGAEHPYLHEAAQELVGICHHPSAGAFVIAGWRRHGPLLSFPMEYGSHTGPGLEETNAFALLPMDAPLPQRAHGYLRPLDLRQAALHFLGRAPAGTAPVATVRPRAAGRLRLLTYNVHRCLGMDGKLSPTRIARVIARYAPDVVALQEVDVKHRSTGGVDQTEHIARLLGMTGQFHPALRMKDGDYGIAVMSRYPMQLMKADVLPRLRAQAYYQPRAALWVTVDVMGAPVQVINTHLSLWPEERLRQIEALLGREWLRHPRCRAPEVLCGDFNAWPGSPVYRQVSAVLQDAQRAVSAHEPKHTWAGRWPLARIDHVFVGSRVRVLGIEVPTTALERVASDHLPLIVDVQLPAVLH